MPPINPCSQGGCIPGDRGLNGHAGQPGWGIIDGNPYNNPRNGGFYRWELYSASMVPSHIDVSTVSGARGVGQPGTIEGFVPIWGSGRAAVDDFQNGRWGWGTFNAVMAVSDIFLVKTAGTIVVKGAWKGGSHTWKATRAWLGRTGFAEKWQHVHHAIVSQEYFRGTRWQAIFNQPWNLKALEPPPGVTMDTWHKMIEGKLPG